MTNSVAARYTTLVESLRSRRESGQNSLEYLGMALVAGIVIVAILGVVNAGSVGAAISKAWGQITGG